MTKSRTKVSNERKATDGPRFVALHQDELMEATTKGFISASRRTLVAETSASEGSIRLARGELGWGHVFLAELGSATERVSPVVSGPLMLRDVRRFLAPSPDAAEELEARLQTFDDTMPAAISIVVEPSMFSAGDIQGSPVQDSFPLGGDARTGAEPAGADAKVLEVAIDKAGGCLAMVRWRGLELSNELNDLARLAAPIPGGAGQAADCLTALAAIVYDRGVEGDASNDDRQIFLHATALLASSDPRGGIDPSAFASTLASNVPETARPEASAFAETLRKVLDNRIELTDSKLDDSGRLGQRSLLAFLLAPTSEQWGRSLASRSIGSRVSLLGSFLCGAYCGLGGLSRGMKGPDTDSFLGVTTLAWALATGQSISVRETHKWLRSGARVEDLLVDGYVFASRSVAPSRAIRDLISELGSAPVEFAVDPSSGAITAYLARSGLVATIEHAVSTLRCGKVEVVQAKCAGKPPTPAAFAKDFLAALLEESLRPVVPSVSMQDKSVRLTAEADVPSDVARLLAKLDDAAASLSLAAPVPGPDSTGKRPRRNKKPG
jgi:hypothetical protein